MVSCPFNGRKGSKCSVMARRRTRVTLLALGRQPSMGWRSWRCYSSLIMTMDDIGGLVGPIRCPPIPGVVHTSDGRRVWGGLFTFARMHILGWVWLDILYVYICLSLFFPPFFFFLTLGTLFCIDGSLAAWHTLWPHVWLRLAGKPRFRWKSFQFPAFFKAKGLLILIFSFCSFSLLLLSFFPSACGVSNFLRCAFRPLSSQFPPNFKVCSLFKLFFLSDFLSFEFLFSFFLCIFLW